MNAVFWTAAILAPLSAAGALAYFQFRHVALSALIVLAPCAVFFLIPVLPRITDDQYIFLPFTQSFFTLCGLLMGERALRGIAVGSTKASALASSVGTVAASALPFLAAFLLAAAWPAMRHELEGLGCMVLISGVVAFGSIWLALAFRYSEDFIVRANQARERREHVAMHIAAFAQTRWAFSIVGCALVLATVMGFGLRAVTAGPLSYCIPAAAALVLLAALATTRDWRMAAAFTATLALFAVAMAAQAPPRIETSDLLIFGCMLAAIAAPMSMLARAWSGSMRRGDEVLPALSQALLQEGPMVVFAAAYLFLAWLFFAAFHPPSPLYLAAACVLAGLAVFPALTVTIHALLPRYRSVEDLFGKR